MGVAFSSLASAANATTAANRPNDNATGARAAGRINADFNTFLTLLTTQLKNQDPMKAMDTQEMTAQLAQFSQVEQSLAQNQNLERLISLQQGSQMISAGPILGRTVEIESDQIPLQSGQGTIRIAGTSAPTVAQIAIMDSSTGRIIRTADVNVGANGANWRWDGRDSSGRQLQDGTYKYQVLGVTPGSSAAPAPLPATILARATGVERQGGDVKLQLGTLNVPFSSLKGIPNT